jgi:hypothetical protein
VVPGAGIEPARLAAGDFESPASTNFTTRATHKSALNYGTGRGAMGAPMRIAGAALTSGAFLRIEVWRCDHDLSFVWLNPLYNRRCPRTALRVSLT